MKKYIISCFLALSAIACQQEKPKNMPSENNLKGLVVVNEEDPICHMKTSGSLNDTAVYKGSVYGFCSEDCKAEFKRKPEAYSLP